jgi:hypothetical protein
VAEQQVGLSLCINCPLRGVSNLVALLGNRLKTWSAGSRKLPYLWMFHLRIWSKLEQWPQMK